jgi:hypothetical protein
VDHHNTLMPYSDLKQTAAWQCCVTKRASLAQRGSVLQPRTALRLPPQELDFRLACLPRPQRNLTREGFGRMVVRVLRCVSFFLARFDFETPNSNFNVRTVCVTTGPHTPRLGQRERDRGSQPAAIHHNDVQAAHASGCGVVCVRILSDGWLASLVHDGLWLSCLCRVQRLVHSHLWPLCSLTHSLTHSLTYRRPQQHVIENVFSTSHVLLRLFVWCGLHRLSCRLCDCRGSFFGRHCAQLV